MTTHRPPTPLTDIKAAPLAQVVGTDSGGTSPAEDEATKKAARDAGLALPTRRSTGTAAELTELLRRTWGHEPHTPVPVTEVTPPGVQATPQPAPPMIAPAPVINHAAIQAVMDNYASYTYFHEFLRDMLAANETSAHSLAKRREGATDNHIFTSIINNCLKARNNPTYAFIEELADRNLLCLEPPPSADATDPAAISNRVRLFTVAGLIEITPQNIKSFNAEVCAGVERNMAQYAGQNPPEWLTWNNAVKRMVDFRIQGDHQTYSGIMAAMGEENTDRRILQSVLEGRNSKLMERLKPKLYDFLGLEPEQCALLDRLPYRHYKKPIAEPRALPVPEPADPLSITIIKEGTAHPPKEKKPDAASAHDVIAEAKQRHDAGQPVELYPLFVSLFRASDVRMNCAFKPTDKNPPANLPHRRGEINARHFNRSAKVVEGNAAEFLGFIAKTQEARENTPLSQEDISTVMGIVEAMAPEKPVKLSSAKPFLERLISSNLDPSATRGR